MRHMTYFSVLPWFAIGQPSLSPPLPPARSILSLKSASLHQSSASSLLVDLTIRMSLFFCNFENVPNKQTKKKQRPMILIPLEPLFSLLTTFLMWFSITLAALKTKISDHICMRQYFSYFQSKHPLIPFLIRNSLSQNPCEAVKNQQWKNRVRKDIFGIWDLTKIRCGIRENTKYPDGKRDLTATREAGFANILARDAGSFYLSVGNSGNRHD